MTTIIQRDGWNAAPSRGASNALNAKPDGVAIHWEGPRMGTRPHSQCAALVRSIQAFHQNSRGWADIAYNLLVCEHGVIYVGRGKGRGSAANGTTDANRRWYAICALVGEGDTVTAALLSGLKDAAALCRSWGAGPRVTGHRDHFNTACPGAYLYAQVRAGRFNPLPARVVKAVSRATTTVRQAVSRTPLLRQGSKGAAVKALQAGLRRVFPSYAGHLVVDGDFGPATAKAVGDFQRRSGLSADRVVGVRTWGALAKYGIRP